MRRGCSRRTACWTTAGSGRSPSTPCRRRACSRGRPRGRSLDAEHPRAGADVPQGVAAHEARGAGGGAAAHADGLAARAALVGDACGYVDPLTGEGIYFALHGAKSLALAIESALANPATAEHSMRAYEARRRREVGPRLALAALLQRGLRHPGIVRAAIGALRRIPRLCDLLVNLTGDAIHPRDLLSPSFWREWQKARRSA